MAIGPSSSSDLIDASVDQSIAELLVISFAVGWGSTSSLTTRRRWRSPFGTTWPTHSDLADRTNRSA